MAKLESFDFRQSTFAPREPFPKGVKGRVKAGDLANRAYFQALSKTPAMQIQIVLLAITLVLGRIRGFGRLSYLLIAMTYANAQAHELRNSTQELAADVEMTLAARAVGYGPDQTDEELIGLNGHPTIGRIKDWSAGSLTPIAWSGVLVTAVLLIWPL